MLGEVHQHDLLAGGGLVSLAARVEAVLLRQRGAGAGLGAPPLPSLLATILGILKRDLVTGITIRLELINFDIRLLKIHYKSFSVEHMTYFQLCGSI